DRVSVRGGRASHGARPGTIRHFLFAVPRPHRRRRRHDRAPGLSGPANASHRSSSARPCGALLRRDDGRLRRHARLRGADRGRRSLGRGRVHPRAAARRARHDRGRAGRPAWSASVIPFKETAGEAIPELAPLQRKLFIAGAIGMALSLVGLLINVTQFLQSYLLAYMWCLGVTLGCLAFGMVHQLSGGAWGVVIRRPIGAAARVLPVMTAMFLPIALGMRHLYPWTNAELVAGDEALQHKQLYLNTPFFLVRAAFYFLVWNAISYFLNAWSLEQDRTANPRLARRMQMLSGGGLLAY